MQKYFDAKNSKRFNQEQPLCCVVLCSKNTMQTKVQKNFGPLPSMLWCRACFTVKLVKEDTYFKYTYANMISTIKYK